MKSKKTDIELVEETDSEIPVMSLQKANADHSLKMTIPKEDSLHIKVNIASKVKIRKAFIEGQPALLVIPLKLA